MTHKVAWLPVKQVSFLGFIPILSPNVNISNLFYETSDKMLSINVSGIRFKIKQSVFRRFPNTLLGSDEKDYFYDEPNGEYFFDRDPVLFQYILSYYQQGKLHFPRSVCASVFENELQFFAILSGTIDNCCYEDYLDQSKEIQQRIENEQKYQLPPVDNNVNFKQKLHQIFENPKANKYSAVVYYTTGFFIIISVLANMIETIPHPSSVDLYQTLNYGDLYGNVFFCLDTACVLIFTVEYVARFYAASNRWYYVRSIMAIVDLVAILPFYISLILPSSVQYSGSLITLRVFRVFRIFKFSRHSQGLRILGCTLKTCAQELGFLLFSLSLFVIIFATIIYYIERFDQNTRFYSIPDASWYTIVTMTTLGYGDMVPSTVMGKIVGSFCSLCGVLVIALPVPVIVSNFSRIYQQKQKTGKHYLRRKLQSNNQQYACQSVTDINNVYNNSSVSQKLQTKDLVQTVQQNELGKNKFKSNKYKLSKYSYKTTTQKSLKTLASWTNKYNK